MQAALLGFERFSDGARCWSWGKDELNMVAISCYVVGIQPPIPARRFDNAVKLLLAAGMPLEDLAKTPSNFVVAVSLIVLFASAAGRDDERPPNRLFLTPILVSALPLATNE